MVQQPEARLVRVSPGSTAKTVQVNLDSIYFFAAKVLAYSDSVNLYPVCVSINEPIKNIVWFTYTSVHLGGYTEPGA